MAKRKPIERGRIIVPHLGVNIPLMIDDNNRFYAKFGDHSEWDYVASIVNDKMVHHIQNTFTVTWQPIIRVSMLKPNIHSNDGIKTRCFVGFTLFRELLGTKANNECVVCNWDEAEEFRVYSAHSFGQQAPLVFPIERASGWGEITYYYEYTETLWERLNWIKDQITTLSGMLDILLGSLEGMERLLAAPMTALLTEGT